MGVGVYKALKQALQLTAVGDDGDVGEQVLRKAEPVVPAWLPAARGAGDRAVESVVGEAGVVNGAVGEPVIGVSASHQFIHFISLAHRHWDIQLYSGHVILHL